MKELIKVTKNESGQQIVSARDLYEFLELSERFSKWFERMSTYGFILHSDYTPYQMVHPDNKQEIEDFALTIDCAKEISMLQRTEKGKQARQYFIACEKKVNDISSALLNPDTIIELANRWKEQIRLTEEAKREIEKKDVIISYLEPKAAATDDLLSTNQTLDIGTFAKVINWGPNKLFDQLRKDGYLITSGEKYNQPYAHYVGKYFEVTEKVWEKKNGDKCISVQSRITPKGQVYFANKYSIRKNLPVFNQIQSLSKTVYS